MRPADIRRIRTDLGLSQVAYASLFGVHSVTVSKWERGILSPSPWQEEHLVQFRRAAESKAVRATIVDVIQDRGSLTAMIFLLNSAVALRNAHDRTTP